MAGVSDQTPLVSQSEHDDEDDRVIHQLIIEGKVQRLVEMYKNNDFHPKDDEDALRKAEEVGQLKKLLCVFPFPLDRFPELSERTMNHSLPWLRGSKRQEDKQQLRKFIEVLGDTHPTPEASMLANFLMVPGKSSAMIMDKIFEEMVVFTHKHEKKDPKNDNVLPLKPIVAMMTFPEQLGALYINREVTLEEIKNDHIKYDKTRSVLSFTEDSYTRIEELKNLDSSWSSSVTGGMDLQQKREQYEKYGILVTSEQYKISLSGKRKDSALIPSKAESYVFVLPGYRLPHGGFLYLTKDDKPLAVNALTFNQQRTAFAFSKKQQLVQETTDYLKKRAFKVPHAHEDILSSGVTHCAWVGHGEKIPGLKFTVDQNGQTVEVKDGGFAYFYADPKKNCFFANRGAARVLERGCLSWAFGRTEMNVALMDEDVSGESVEDAIHFARFNPLRRVACFKHKLNASTVPTKVFRCSVPGVLHPRVLHGLAHTPEENVLKTAGAKAIAYQGYQQAKCFVAFQICTHIYYLVCLHWFARYIRDDDTKSHQCSSAWCQRFIAGSVILIFSKNVYIYWKLAWEFSRWNWFCAYFCTWGRGAEFLAGCLEIVLIYDLLQEGEPARQQMKHGHDPLPFMDERTGLFVPEWAPVRGIIAILAATFWIRLLLVLSGLEFMNFGSRILPISKTLGEMFSFLFVMTFFFGAAYSVSYAITNEPMTDLLLNTYKMAFAGDYTEKMYFNANWSDGVGENIIEDHGWTFFLRFVIYCLFGVLLMVALNNIFIGIMSNTYDHFQERAGRLVVRQRAIMALDYALLTGRFDSTKMLWACIGKRGVDDDDLGERLQDVSLRSNLSDMSAKLEGKVGQVITILDTMNEKKHNWGIWSPKH